MKTRSSVNTWVVAFVFASAVLLVGQASFASTLPPEIGLQLWLKADAGVVTDGVGVNAWQDQSGVGNNATQTRDAVKPQLSTISTPVNPNQPIINFGGTSDMVFSLPGAKDFSGFSVFVVASWYSRQSQTLIGSDQDLGTSGSIRWDLGAGYQGTAGLGFAGTNGAIPLGAGPYGISGQLFVGSFVKDKTGGAARKGQWNINMTSGGTVVASSTVEDASFPTGDFSGVIGAEIDSSLWALQAPFLGGVCEVLIYDHAVTGSELTGVESYLNGRYVTTAPEPSAAILVITALVGLLAYAWRKRR